MDRTLIVIVYGTDAFGNEVALTNLFPEDKLAGGTQVEIPEGTPVGWCPTKVKVGWAKPTDKPVVQ